MKSALNLQFLPVGPRSLRLLAATAAMVLAAAPAWPATGAILTPSQLKNLTVEELLAQEVISVSRRPETWITTPSNLFYLTGDSARRTGAIVLPELLRLAPNLFVAQSSSHHWGVTARGFLRTNAHSTKLLVLIDGRTAYSTLFSNVFWDSAVTFLPDLAGMEILSGPNGANWGANAVNGIINVRSKSAHETLGSLAELAVGDDLVQADVRHGVRFGATGAIRFYASRTERGPTLSATGGDDERDGWSTSLGGFRADWGQADTGAFTLQGEGMQGTFDSRPGPRAENDNAHLMLTWRRQESETAETWARVYYDYNQRDFSGAMMQTTQTMDFEFQRRMELGGGSRFMWGANFRRMRDVAEPMRPGFAILPEKLWYNLYSGFIQHEMPLAREGVSLTTGLRAEHSHFSGWEYQPTLRLAWRGAGRTAWLSAARAVRTPSRIDRGLFVPEVPPFTFAGGPEFASEELHAFEAGWRAQPTENLWYSVTAFFHDYDKLLSQDPGPPTRIENDVEGRSYGVEAFLEWQVTRPWRLRTGGTWLDQETWVKAGGVDLEAAQGDASVPDYHFFLRSTFQLSARTELWLNLRRVADVPAFQNGGGTVPAYTELDARLACQVRPALELALVGKNLLNESHPEIGGVLARREVRRSFYGTIRWEF